MQITITLTISQRIRRRQQQQHRLTTKEPNQMERQQQQQQRQRRQHWSCLKRRAKASEKWPSAEQPQPSRGAPCGFTRADRAFEPSWSYSSSRRTQPRLSTTTTRAPLAAAPPVRHRLHPLRQANPPPANRLILPFPNTLPSRLFPTATLLSPGPNSAFSSTILRISFAVVIDLWRVLLNFYRFIFIFDIFLMRENLW